MRLLTCLTALLVASTAYADGKDESCKQQPEPAKADVHIEYRHGVAVHVIKNDVIICGHRPRPSVAIVDVAGSINYEWESLQQDFLPQVLASVKKAPF